MIITVLGDLSDNIYISRNSEKKYFRLLRLGGHLSSAYDFVEYPYRDSTGDFISITRNVFLTRHWTSLVTLPHYNII